MRWTSSFKKIAIVGAMVLMVVAVLTTVLMTTRKSKEARMVIRQIKEVTSAKVTIDSITSLNEAEKAYQGLTDDDKSDVKNYSELQNAFAEYYVIEAADFDTRVENKIKTVAAESYENLVLLRTEFDRMEEEAKSQVTMLDALDEAIVEAGEYKALSVIAQIKEYKNDGIDTIMQLISQNSQVLNEEQRLECLVWYGRWASLAKAEAEIKTYLKSPRSYNRYSGSITEPILLDDGSYRTLVKLEFGAENSFGAELRENEKVYCYFDVDTTNLKVTFTKVERWTYSFDPDKPISGTFRRVTSN